MPAQQTPRRVVFITGSSSGFGRVLTDIALANGDNVVATLRKPEVLKDLRDRTPSDRLLVLKLDVTKQDDVTNAFAQAKAKFGRVDVVFNNAGYSVAAVVEATPEDVARELFETNFWGSSRVSREAVRFFRDENPKGAGGRLIVNSSVVGLNAFQGVGYYSATKYATEAITQALARELDPAWNIKISLFEPGNFRTEVWDSAPRLPIPEQYLTPEAGYAQAAAVFAKLSAPDFKMGDPRKGTQKVYDLSKLENPPLRLVLGRDSIESVRGQLEHIKGDIGKYESWSDDVRED